MPPKESVDKKLRRRIALHIEAKLKEMDWKPAEFCRRTGVDPGFLSKLLDPLGELTIGLDNFYRISFVINANTLLHRRAPGEKNEPPPRNGQTSDHPGPDSGL